MTTVVYQHYRTLEPWRIVPLVVQLLLLWSKPLTATGPANASACIAVATAAAAAAATAG
jgi:hypothetical protein